MRTHRSMPLLVVISAPSGGGKTTVCRELLATQPSLTRAITCTTREPRPGERPEVDYYFLDPATFARRVEAGEFLEHAVVYGNHYGTLKAEVASKLDAGMDVLLNVDVQGVANLRAVALADPRLAASLVTIFLAPPTLSTLAERLRRRGQDSEEVIQRRLSVARAEIARWAEFDYLVVSQSIADDLGRVLALIEAEKLRSHRCAPPCLE